RVTTPPQNVASVRSRQHALTEDLCLRRLISHGPDHVAYFRVRKERAARVRAELLALVSVEVSLVVGAPWIALMKRIGGAFGAWLRGTRLSSGAPSDRRRRQSAERSAQAPVRDLTA